MERFDAEGALAAIERYRATHSQWVPTMFVRMLKLPPEVRERYDVSSMRVAIHAAAPCPVDVKRAMIDWWGPVIYEYYAATEAVGITFIDSAQWLEHPGSVGRAGLGEVRIADPDTGELLPAGRVGTVYFERHDGPLFTYHNDPEKTRASRHPGARRLGHHRRPRLPRRRRLALPHRPQGIHDHLRRGEHLPAATPRTRWRCTPRCWTSP